MPLPQSRHWCRVSWQLPDRPRRNPKAMRAAPATAKLPPHSSPPRIRPRERRRTVQILALCSLLRRWLPALNRRSYPAAACARDSRHGISSSRRGCVEIPEPAFRHIERKLPDDCGIISATTANRLSLLVQPTLICGIAAIAWGRNLFTYGLVSLLECGDNRLDIE